jgi:Domain of unknown function (DUF6371)
MSFGGALRHLRNMAGLPGSEGFAVDHESKPEDYGWAPVLPVPTDAPPLVLGNGWTSPIYNPKSRGESDEWKIWRPALVHSYRGAAGELLGFVLRCQFPSGKKFCPAVTYCVNNAGERRWCLIPFPRPRALYGLDRLAAGPGQGLTVVLVEGEKTADAAQRLLPSMVAMTWAGGAKAYQHADFAPLAGRKVICIPDADAEGRAAFHGRSDSRGRHVSGILEILAGIGGIARCVEPASTLTEGWDLADAQAAGWDTARTIAWIKTQLSMPAPCRMTGTSR